ncbi:MAG TPA: hypothetical protein VFP22_09355 [Candidatus Limnocylindrales bacterium]|nr:hypothetical protein [Candidatus Limnocylindrales bacterium]
MTDQHDRQDRRDSQTDSLGGQATDEGDAGVAGALGNATPGAGSNWTPGTTAGSESSSDAMLGDKAPGTWGNRSGSGSGGQGERELEEDGGPGIADDVVGTEGTNG